MTLLCAKGIVLIQAAFVSWIIASLLRPSQDKCIGQ